MHIMPNNRQLTNSNLSVADCKLLNRLSAITFLTIISNCLEGFFADIMLHPAGVNFCGDPVDTQMNQKTSEIAMPFIDIFRHF
mgnify:CR=1 FL=1